MIKYLSISTDGDMRLWNYVEDAEDSIFEYGLSAGEKAFIYEIEVEPADLNDSHMFIIYNDYSTEFFKSPDERDKEDDDIISEAFKVKRCSRSWEFKLEITTYVNNRPELPF